jgi:hypothetical protein
MLYVSAKNFITGFISISAITGEVIATFPWITDQV